MKRISKTEIKEMRSQSKKNRIMFAFTYVMLLSGIECMDNEA